jgi:hypothetical protein
VTIRSRLAVSTLVAVGAGLAACDAAPPRDRGEVAEPSTTTWRPLGSWSGSGNIQTESFTVDTGALRLAWETRNETSPGGGRFRVSLHSAISGRPLQTIVDRTGPGAGTAYAEDEPRVSYLVIESTGIEWTATLDEALPAGDASPRR